MSQENLIAFVEKIVDNPDLKAEVQALENDLAEIVALGQREALDFTEQELLAFLQETAVNQGELTDDELTQVAGGIPGDGGYAFTYRCTEVGCRPANP